ncbi:unnamed protein product [Effrenium voratum]|uniref:Uncharacterized protein n=1 Tax=Effrenium voratum TaxID=2562239 RepID=A0AA36J7M6_9DINO|nr:unnamed protein product [Effrenium voratum]
MPAPSTPQIPEEPFTDFEPDMPGTPATARQRLRDAAHLFEGHLAGVVKAFQLLQQQSNELMVLEERKDGQVGSVVSLDDLMCNVNVLDSQCGASESDWKWLSGNPPMKGLAFCMGNTVYEAA